MKKVPFAAVILFSLATAATAASNFVTAPDLGSVYSPKALLAAKVPAASFPQFVLKGGDTSGCSVQEQRRQYGAVSIAVTPVPSRSCWNLPDGGFTLEYKWLQKNVSAPARQIGFWVSLNNRAMYAPATGYKCEPAINFSYGPDTSGATAFDCTASARFSFGANSDLLFYAYDQSGKRNAWDIQAAVSLGNNAWDSLNGNNYRFRF